MPCLCTNMSIFVTFFLVTVVMATPYPDYSNVPNGAASLAFVFDITGSMYDDLLQVIDGARNILRTTLSRREKPLYNYVLVPFHDPDVGPVVVTTDPDDFQHELKNLYVQGGGDCPEMSVTAIREAIDVSLPNSFIYVFTDARSKDFHLTNDVLALVQKKQSQVVFVLTGDCDDPVHDGYKAYEKIASTSSGQVFLLKKSQVNEVLKFVRVAVQTRRVNLMSVDVDNNSNKFEVPIDSKLKEFTISVSGQKPKITLIDSSGNKVTRAKGLKKLLDIRNALIVNVKRPLPGQWSLQVESRGPHTIRMTGLSTTDISLGFSRKPVETMKDTSHRPIEGVSTYMMVNATDMPKPAVFTRVELLDLKGNVLGDFTLDREPDDPDIYRAPSFVPPEDFFYVKVSGLDNEGFRIQRLTPTAITAIKPDKPSLWMPEVTKGYFGHTAVLTCKVDSLIPFTVRWFKEEVEMGGKQYFLESTNASIEIPGANHFSEGIYFCNASNNAGSRRIPTFLDISEPPPSITIPQNASVLPGDDALLTCDVFSTVDYNITWFADGYRGSLKSGQKFVDYRNGSLVVRNVGLEDEGKYTCRASNEGGSTDQHAYVRVQVPPIPSIKPPKASFVAGDSVTLVCKSKGYPSPSLHWIRGGLPMIPNENVIISEGTLELRNLQKGDAGGYSCLARNPAGEKKVEAVLSYIEAPVMLNHDGRVLVASGDEAVLSCVADGIPSPEMRWYKGDVELKEVSYVQISANGELRILGAHSLDAGEYRCEAVNEAGSVSALVDLEVGSAPEITEAPENIGVDIGLNATLHCRAKGLPVPKVFWQRFGGQPMDHSGRTKQLESGALFIQGVTVEDEGSYVCVAQNQFGTIDASAYVSITGIEAPLIGFMDPLIQVQVGDDVELNCQVLLGNPRPVVEWWRHGQVLQSDVHIQEIGEGNVILTNVQEEHAGQYLCSAVNVGGNATFIVEMEIFVPPTFNMSSIDADKTEFEIIEGDRVVIPCDVTGSPRPFITWYKDESPISLTDYHYFIREDGSLEIYSAEASDTGSYRCQASNEAGDIEKNVGLYVQVPPSIAGEPTEEYIITENNTIVLPCQVDGEPAPEVSWRRNFIPFTPEDNQKFLFGDYGMTISNVKKDDTAFYECVATNVAGETSKTIMLIVQIPPMIVSSGSNDLIVVKGQEVLLGCDSIGDPTPSFEWMKDETMITIYDAENGYEILDTGSLQIGSAEVSHSGRYNCLVTNPAGVDTRDFTLVVHDPPSLPANLTHFQDITENNPIVLHCPASGTPTPLITWYKNEELITGDQLGLIILEDGSLQIQDAEADDSAQYKCKAENQAGQVEHEVELKVLVPPKLTGKDVGQPGVIDRETVVVTKNKTLLCPVEADPPPLITWLKNSVELDPGSLDSRFSISQDGRTLYISDAEVADKGRYTCIAENPVGEVEKSFDLDVHVPPRIDVGSMSPGNTSVVKDNPLYLDCPVSGTPRPNVAWFKDGEAISPDLDPNINLLADGRRLELLSARVSDTGRYSCEGENVAGKVAQDFEVFVQVPPKVDKPGEISKPEIVEGNTVEIICPAYGVPPPQVTWFRNNQQITGNDSHLFIINDGWAIKIPKVAVTDSVRYTCRAKNTAGESEKAFDLNVLVPPKIDRINIDVTPKVTINHTKVLNCPVEGKPTPDIKWYKNGIQLVASQGQARFEILAGGRQLRLRNAQLIDTAMYTCDTVNKAGADSLDIRLTVHVPSRIEIHNLNTNRKVVENGSLSLSCPATGVPPPIVKWYKEGELINTEKDNIEISEGGRELVIINAQVDDTALYTCEAINPAGESEINYNVDVQVPPTIDATDLDPSPNVIVDETVTLNCPADGVPFPALAWFKNGQPISYSRNPHFTLIENGKALRISRAMVKDIGIYTCEATNEAGQVEESFDLDIWVPPKIDRTNLDEAPSVIKNHSISLMCPTAGNPDPKIIWLKDGEPVQFDIRVTLHQANMMLKIDKAEVTDTAQYSCVARNAAGQDSFSFDLEVYVPPSIDESNVVYYRKVVVNQSIIIECPVSGIPPPEVSWLINGRPLVGKDGITLTHNNQFLEMGRAEVTDTANYTCVADNAAGQLRKNFDLEVQVPPVIDLRGVNLIQNVIQNRSHTIYCRTNGIPRPSILWLKDIVPLLDWPYPRLGLSGDSSRLTFTGTQVEDAAKYTCIASNLAGEVEVDFTLNVHVPPMISGGPFVSDLEVVKGSSISMECAAIGLPEPILTWMMGNEIIETTENPNIRTLNNGKVLQIVEAEVADTGRYKCHAENRAGIDERLYDLDVFVPPKITVPSGVQHVWVVNNSTLTLECPVEGIPPPSVTWYKEGTSLKQYTSRNYRVQDDGRRLLVLNAHVLDLGEYMCTADNVAGTDSRTYNVSVYVPPTIEDGATVVQAVVNTRATLPCQSLGLPGPKVTWLKDGELFPRTGLRHQSRVSGTIDFTSVRLEDAGKYKCTATNDAGTVSREMQLDVQVPPRVLGRQPLFLKAVKGAAVLLPCDVTGTPPPRILWQKGTKVIQGAPGVDILANGSLYLQRSDKGDAGVYVCIAQNAAGAAFGHVRLQIQELPNIRVRETDFTVVSARNIVLPCRATGRPRPKLSWEKNGVPIKSSNAYVRLVRNGLAIPFARPEDAGTYTCIASNNAGNTKVDLALTVQVPPQIAEASRLLTFTIHDKAVIECAAIGIPPPTVEWLKDGRQINLNSPRFKMTDFGTLIIGRLKESDTGSYLCTAENVAGRAQQERLLRVQVPPTFIVVPQVQEVLLNSRLELRCTADGIPTPTIHWKKDDVPVPSQPSVNGRSTFYVNSVRPEDGGQYMCLAQNPAGQASVNTLVTVKVPPEILTSPGNKAVNIAEKIVLSCSVGGDPQPEVIWMKNGRPVRLSSRIQKLSNSSLVIYNSTSSDAGEYKCVATNDVGTSTGVAMLTVREPPSFSIEPGHTWVDVGETVFIDCLGSGEPAPEMNWMIEWDILQDKGRLAILPNNTLRIFAAQLSDSGAYRCLASNNLGQSFVEVNLTVVVHGEWSTWSPWESCTTTCGKGRQLRHRTCDNPESANGGRDCTGADTDKKPCQLRECPVNGGWGSWLPWEPCSGSCGIGVRVHYRHCDNPPAQYGGADCVGDESEEEPCSLAPCSIDGVWGEWTDWGPCSMTCGDGIQERSRLCDNPPPQLGGAHCTGSDVNRQTCNLRPCPVDGVWSHWGSWAQCSLSCGGGVQTRERSCDNPEPQYGGQHCVGSDAQKDYCNSEPCPVHGGWSDWGDYGECSVSCNGGLQRRFRTCSNPQPSNNGRPCSGPSEDTVHCNEVPCPFDGFWSPWSNWTECSKSCDKGTRQRERVCSQPRHGGLGCRGDSLQLMDCELAPCYEIPIIAEGKLVGFINNINIPAATFSADMIPLPDNSATHINATIRGIPDILTPHFRHLISVLSPVYWTTALEQEGAYNGYTLTKGDFTREIQVQYATGEILKMSQYSKGVDHEGKLQMDIVVRGNVPEIPESQIVRITPYREMYTQTGPGSLYASSTRLFHVDEHVLPYAWNHTIVYDDSKDLKMPYLVQQLYARNMEIDINPSQQLVHYKLDASVGPGSPSNQCPPGFVLNTAGSYCEDEDECARNRPCSDYCHNSPGSFACSCPFGYTLDSSGRNCVDVDECSTGQAECSGRQECINTIGSYTCAMKCRRGYRPSEDGLKCLDINECEEKPGVCSQRCNNRKGGYRCSCNDGYKRQSQGRCRDINECKLGTHNCNPSQKCVNSLGSYSCRQLCKRGSRNVNGRCIDINECRTGRNRCYSNQKCVNTDPGYRCDCPTGYRSAGPGTPCLDIDECTEMPGICAYKCENTHGGYECSCAPGQVRLSDRKSCAGLEFLDTPQIIDTSSIQTHAQTRQRQPAPRYHRNKRSAVEPCTKGWRMSETQDKCIDINECTDDPGVCQHNCTNTIGSYVCTCPPGYRPGPDGNCEDINECIELSIQCGPEKMCFNTRGEFTCIDVPCPTDYQRDPITNYCVLECIDAEIACPTSQKYADIIQFRTLALPSGVVTYQDLLKLKAYNHDDQFLPRTTFTILKNDEQVAFQMRLQDGVGIVYTPQPLQDMHLYRIKVQARSYDHTRTNIQYQTTFIIHISVSAYPY